MKHELIQLLIFSFLCYPVLGAITVTIGLVLYRYVYRYKIVHFKKFPVNDEPLVTIAISAFNEQKNISKVIRYLATRLNYHNYEILVVDDGSSDDTWSIIKRLSYKYRRLRVIHVVHNNGKAHALNLAIGFARGDYILSNDADTIPEADCLWKYLNYFRGPQHLNVGAVTGNIKVINKSSLIAKSQIVEFSSIIGAIKREQMITSHGIYALSGANTMYRKSALIDAGGFRQDRATEDISMTWDMNYRGWQTLFAPDVVFWILVPVTFLQLVHQRKRWSQGGTEVLLSNFKRIIRHPRRMAHRIPMFLNGVVSTCWCFAYFVMLFVVIGFAIYDLVNGIHVNLQWFLTSNSILICLEYLMCAVQLLLSLHFDQHGSNLKYILYSPLYITFLWIINPYTVVATFGRAVRTVFGHASSGTWVSPGR